MKPTSPPRRPAVFGLTRSAASARARALGLCLSLAALVAPAWSVDTAARADDIAAPQPACTDASDEDPDAGADAGAISGHAGPTAPTGPTAPPPADAARGASDLPFAGLVLGEEVNVRAGPSTSYEAVARLAGGERLTVLAEQAGWYAVQCAREVPVYVHEGLLEQRTDGVGVVRKDRVNLRARPAAEASVVGQVARGDLCRVIGREGEWVAVAAPPQATFYIHRDFVRRTGSAAVADPVVAAGAAAAAAAQPAGSAGAAPTTSDAAMDLLIEARDLYLAELDQTDMDRMDFARALALYEDALRRADRADIRAAAEAGARQVRLAMRLQADYRERMRRLEGAKASGR